MTLMGCSYDWEREINSSSPEFYRWTQWFFLLLYRRGLAYRAVGRQWWCPGCKTVLANEQVDANGVCWRGHAGVYKRDMEQWYLRITAYAEQLLDDLATVDWPEHIVAMQRNWIGRSEGIQFAMAIGDGGEAQQRERRGIHHPTGYSAGRDLRRAGARASAGRTHYGDRAASRGRRIP